MLPSSEATPSRPRPHWLALFLFLGTVALFARAVTPIFLPYDDPSFVVENAHVNTGVSWANLRWAISLNESSNWQPITWVSHQIDSQLFGLDARGHHTTSVVLHGLNVALLFLALQHLTRRQGLSLFVAALFAVHPMHVESVAWIAERKDVLSTTFFLLVLWIYSARAHAIISSPRAAQNRYIIALVLFALGLMSKPMLVTLPFVLLLVDYWPLRRWPERATIASLIIEKIPFFLLSIGSAIMTLVAQTRGGAVNSFQHFPLAVRVSNALVSYVLYLKQFVWPADLAIFYPNFARVAPWATLVGCAVLLVAITLACLFTQRTRPYALTGWLWFLGTLVPVIGLVQVGGQIIADRYSYIPYIGLFILVVWLFAELAERWNAARALAVGAAAVIALLGGGTWHQLAYWRDSLALFRHAADVTENNYVAHYNLFIELRKRGSPEAAGELKKTLGILADFAQIYDQDGLALAQRPGQEARAIQAFRTAIRIIPNIPDPHFHLAQLLARQNRVTEAIEEFETTLNLQPNHFAAHLALADLLARDPTQRDFCIAEYQRAVALQPNSFEAHYKLGTMLAQVSWRSGEALEQFEEALQLRPDSAEANAMIQRLR